MRLISLLAVLGVVQLGSTASHIASSQQQKSGSQITVLDSASSGSDSSAADDGSSDDSDTAVSPAGYAMGAPAKRPKLPPLKGWIQGSSSDGSADSSSDGDDSGSSGSPAISTGNYGAQTGSAKKSQSSGRNSHSSSSGDNGQQTQASDGSFEKFKRCIFWNNLFLTVKKHICSSDKEQISFFISFRGWWAVAPWRLAPSTPKLSKVVVRRRRTHLSGMPWTCSVAVRTFPTTKWPTCWPTPNLTWTIPFWVKFRTWKVSAASTWSRLDITPTRTFGTWVCMANHSNIFPTTITHLNHVHAPSIMTISVNKNLQQLELTSALKSKKNVSELETTVVWQGDWRITIIHLSLPGVNFLVVMIVVFFTCRCQVFRRCDLDGTQTSYLCPNQTVSQSRQSTSGYVPRGQLFSWFSTVQVIPLK